MRLRAGPVMPKVVDSLEMRIEWSIVSKAADRSRRTRAVTFWRSQARRMLFVMRRSAVSVE